MKKLLIFLLALSTLSACDKDDDTGVKPENSDNTTNPDSTSSQNITLTYPVNKQDLNPCCIDFTWESTGINNYRFMVSKSETFDTLLVDSTLTAKNINLDYIFNPNTTYYWRVEGGSINETSAFTIKDVLSGLQVNYPNTIINEVYWNMAVGVISDTTYTGTIMLTKEGDNIRFVYLNRFDELLTLTDNNDLANTLQYRKEFMRNFTSLYLNYESDSIHISARAGGIGQATNWNFYLRK